MYRLYVHLKENSTLVSHLNEMRPRLLSDLRDLMETNTYIILQCQSHKPFHFCTREKRVTLTLAYS